MVNMNAVAVYWCRARFPGRKSLLFRVSHRRAALDEGDRPPAIFILSQLFFCLRHKSQFQNSRPPGTQPGFYYTVTSLEAH